MTWQLVDDIMATLNHGAEENKQIDRNLNNHFNWSVNLFVIIAQKTTDNIKSKIWQIAQKYMIFKAFQSETYSQIWSYITIGALKN